MGVEAILVCFPDYTGTPEQLESSLSQLISVTRNPNSAMTSQTMCWVLDDGNHKLEVEQKLNYSGFSLRFALCNPSSIDCVFIRIIKTIIRTHELGLRFCEDCDEVPEWLSSIEMIDQYEAAIQNCIDMRRALWQTEFGKEELAATCAEACRHFILPRGL